MHIHKYVDGFGGMGDAVVCCICGVDKYPEVAPGYLLSVATNNVIRENHPEYNYYFEKALAARARREANHE